MAWKDVCVRGRPAGGRVREDDVRKGDRPEAHDAGGPSPGLLKFLAEVVQGAAPSLAPARPSDFEVRKVEHYPGHAAADVHYEGRAADVYLNYNDPTGRERALGDWLFDWCVQNCVVYQIQGVIFGKRQWFSEMKGGTIVARTQDDHLDHVHVELNGDGAALSAVWRDALVISSFVGNWSVTIGAWNGRFVFDQAGGVSWTDPGKRGRQAGRWRIGGRQLRWHFSGPGDIRTFVLDLPIPSGPVYGSIEPAGQGYFVMRR